MVVGEGDGRAGEGGAGLEGEGEERRGLPELPAGREEEVKSMEKQKEKQKLKAHLITKYMQIQSIEHKMNSNVFQTRLEFT